MYNINIHEHIVSQRFITCNTTYFQFVEAISLEREPTIDELYKDTHMRRKKDNQGNWVCKKSELRLVRLNSIYIRMSFPLKYEFQLTDIL